MRLGWHEDSRKPIPPGKLSSFLVKIVKPDRNRPKKYQYFRLCYKILQFLIGFPALPPLSSRPIKINKRSGTGGDSDYGVPERVFGSSKVAVSSYEIESALGICPIDGRGARQFRHLRRKHTALCLHSLLFRQFRFDDPDKQALAAAERDSLELVTAQLRQTAALLAAP